MLSDQFLDHIGAGAADQGLAQQPIPLRRARAAYPGARLRIADFHTFGRRGRAVARERVLFKLLHLTEHRRVPGRRPRLIPCKRTGEHKDQRCGDNNALHRVALASMGTPKDRSF